MDEETRARFDAIDAKLGTIIEALTIQYNHEAIAAEIRRLLKSQHPGNP